MFQHIVTAWRIDRDWSRMLEHAKLDLYNNQVHGCCNIAVQSLFHHSLTTCSIMCIMMVPTTLFKFIRLSSHEQSVLACMNKPVQQHCSSCPAQPCSSWPAQPCSSLSTGKNTLPVDRERWLSWPASLFGYVMKHSPVSFIMFNTDWILINNY